MRNELKHLAYVIIMKCMYVCRASSMMDTKMWLVHNPVRLMLIGAEIGGANNAFAVRH